MCGQFKSLCAFGKRKAMADQSFEIHLTIHYETDRIVLQVNRGAIGAHQSFLVDTDGCRINHGLSMLRLRKKQYPSTGTSRIHRSANQGIATDSKNDGVGATPFGQLADAFDYIGL